MSTDSFNVENFDDEQEDINLSINKDGSNDEDDEITSETQAILKTLAAKQLEIKGNGKKSKQKKAQPVAVNTDSEEDSEGSSVRSHKSSESSSGTTKKSSKSSKVPSRSSGKTSGGSSKSDKHSKSIPNLDSSEDENDAVNDEEASSEDDSFIDPKKLAKGMKKQSVDLIDSNPFIKNAYENGKRPISTKNKIYDRVYTNQIKPELIVRQLNSIDEKLTLVKAEMASAATDTTFFVKMIKQSDLTNPLNNAIAAKYASSLDRAAKAIRKLCGIPEVKPSIRKPASRSKNTFEYDE